MGGWIGWMTARINRRKRGGLKPGPKMWARLLIGALVLANVAAALVAFKPWAGSLEEMEAEAASLRQQIRTREQTVARLQRNVAKVETARGDGDRFLQEHIMSMRTLSSTLVSELAQVAQKAGIRPKGSTYAFEPVEGADTLTRAIINADYEGTYADLMHFMNLLDRSPRFLIIESLSAAPQQTGTTLSINVKLNAFVREDGSSAAPAAAGAPAEEGAGQ
ncbi:MAG TPA: type 4a pilus biogenesis protein PilO [Bryobacteraceae bacterium]|nr:type 4a pilus biogenesis protein PilO [Bryobacteraceae bacterium]